MWRASYIFLLETAAAGMLSSQGEQIPTFTRWAPRSKFELPRKVHHGKDAQIPSPFLTERVMMEKSLGLSVTPASVLLTTSSHEAGAPSEFYQKWNASEEERPRRVLQSTATTDTGTITIANTCEGEFRIMSNAAPELEGCLQYIATGTTSTFGGEEIYGVIADDQGGVTMFVYAYSFDTLDPPLRWVMAYTGSDTTTDPILYCYSDESAGEVHPVGATWICDLSGEESNFTEVAVMDLVVSCGCSDITPSPSTPVESVDVMVPSTPSPVVITPSTSPLVEPSMPTSIVISTCEEEFRIMSNVAPELEGCLQHITSDTTSTISGEEIYGVIANDQGGVTMLVHAYSFDTLDPPLRWVMAYTGSDTTTDPILYCFSDESADEVHPVDATWTCDLSGAESDFTEVTAMDLVVACGCSGITPSPSTPIEEADLLMPSTPSPMITASAPSSLVGSPLPSSAVTIGCDMEFSVTSDMATVLEGCFKNVVTETTSTISGQEIYGVLANDEGGVDMFVYASTFDTLDPPLRWAMVYAGSDTTTDGILYCYSDESADEVHPADATWLCDLSGAESDFIEVTATDLVVACGCSEVTPSPSSAKPVDSLVHSTPSPEITVPPSNPSGAVIPSSSPSPSLYTEPVTQMYISSSPSSATYGSPIATSPPPSLARSPSSDFGMTPMPSTDSGSWSGEEQNEVDKSLPLPTVSKFVIIGAVFAGTVVLFVGW